MRMAFRILLIGAICLILPVGIIAGWFISGVGLRDVNSLEVYVPNPNGGILFPSDCITNGPLLLLTTNDLRSSFAALHAAEGSARQGYSTPIARRFQCQYSGKQFQREIQEIRFAYRIRRRFNVEEQQTILSNTAYFGDGQWGLGFAAHHYFGLTPAQLDSAQMATLVGLIRAPDRDSPLRHPDRCLKRRNDVLEEMKRLGSLSASQAEAAEAEPLGIRQP